MSLEDYAVKTFEATGLGKQGKDNGVLIVLSLNEDRWRIEVGYGLEGILNDAKVGRIGRDYLEPYLAEEDYGTGLYETVTALGTAIIEGDSVPREDYPVPGIPLNRDQLIVIVIAAAALIVTKGRIFLWIGRGSKRFGGGRSGGGGAGGTY